MVRAARSVTASVLMAAVVLVGNGCSKDGDREADPAASTTAAPTSTSGSSRSTTTLAGPSTSEVSTDTTEAGPTGSPVPPGSGTTFRGRAEGSEAGAGAPVSFEKADGIRNFTAKALTVTCQRDDNGPSTTQQVDVVLPSVPVAADGSVDFTARDHPYRPTLSGAFGKDGRFVGGLFLSRIADGRSCGGEFTFIVDR